MPREGITRHYFRLPQWDVAFVASLYVKPENRGKGRARALMIRFLRRHRKFHVFLEAWPFAEDSDVTPSALTKFYRSFGFKRLRGTGVNLMYKGPTP